jgi:hypothetical protein
VTIDVTGCTAGILGALVNGVIINITAQNDTAKAVRLRGLLINGIGTGTNGIRVVAAHRVFIEDSVIDGFDNNGIQVEATGAHVFVRDTTIRNIRQSGINVQPSGNTPSASVWINRVSLLFSTNGLFVGKGARGTIRDSAIILHKSGVVAEKGEVNVVNCVLTENVVGIHALASSTIRLSTSTVTNNEKGLVALENGRIISFQNNVIHSNQTDGVPTSTVAPQ